MNTTLATAKFQTWTEAQELAEIMGKMATLRNEIQHCKPFGTKYTELVNEHNRLSKRAKFLA